VLKQFKLRCRNCYRWRNGKHEFDSALHAYEKRNQIWTFYYGRWITKDGLVDAYDNNAMGVCADLCATEYEFSREDQDNYAINRTNVQQKHGN
jgi:acetyl-CoA acetyltransferase